MAKTDGVFIYIGTYPNEAVAEANREIVNGLHALDAVSGYDAAVITKDDSGKASLKSEKQVSKQLDVSSNDLDSAIADTAKQLD